MEGHRVWLSILEAIKELQRTRPGQSRTAPATGCLTKFPINYIVVLSTTIGGEDAAPHKHSDTGGSEGAP